MCVANRPTLDVQTTSNFDVGTTGVDRRCIDVVYMLSDVATLFQPIFDVETTSVCLLGIYIYIYIWILVCIISHDVLNIGM